MKGKKLRFRKKEKYKNLVFAIICVSLVFIASGMALIHSTLSINGVSEIAKTVWDVHFENLVVKDGSMEAIVPATIDENDKTKINFSLRLNNPQKYYEFEVDVVNNGTIDAMVSNVNLTGLEDIRQYINVEYGYQDRVYINTRDFLPKSSRDKIKFKLSFNDDDYTDMSEIFGVTTEENITLDISFEITYGQANRNASLRLKSEREVNILGQNMIAYMDNMSSPFVNMVDGLFFSSSSSDINGKGLYVKNGTEDNENPIVYYRGDVNNNVLFADYCWKIVRTTETGGTKLIYNGPPRNGQCNAKGKKAHLSESNFNLQFEDQNVGYTDDTDKDSLVKEVVDTWFENNLISYEQYLEDTVWCNDKSIYDDEGDEFYYAVSNRISNGSPTFTCPQDNDKYTVDTRNGNGKLKYPVALLTADETIYAGYGFGSEQNGTSYLYSGTQFWLMSPKGVNSVYGVYSSGGLAGYAPSMSNGVRPAISLSKGVKIASGTGTIADPYKLDFSDFNSIDGLSITLDADKESVIGGDDLTYTIIAKNTSDIAKKITINVLLPYGVQLKNTNPSLGYSSSDFAINWTPIVASNSEVTLIVVTIVNDNSKGNLVNVADLTSGDGTTIQSSSSNVPTRPKS